VGRETSVAGPFSRRSGGLGRLQPLGQAHDRPGFVCGPEPLERYFTTQVTQDIRRRIAKCFVLVELATGRLAGFYTLSATSVVLSEIPDGLFKALPRFPVIPCVLIGRLAVASHAQGRKLGTATLAHAIETIALAPIGVFAIVVEAKDDAARAFYQRHGFTSVNDRENRLILPLATALKALGIA
jgi:GNAT superfamily N-acetyltransferase